MNIKHALAATLGLHLLLAMLTAQGFPASVGLVGSDIVIRTVNGNGRVLVDGDKDIKKLFDKYDHLEVRRSCLASIVSLVVTRNN
jgi:hypothetical protein